ncbi:hypothetical protein LCGC14_0909580 [marine sediment metagenome]|uniref:HTH marR-type domain-containing protein n=1 Tax=marine sediment metagenome TaxID=412755 RepID=A0A0F9PES8_9ZZZZ
MKLGHLFYAAPLKLFKEIANSNGEVIYAALAGRTVNVSYAYTSKIVREFEKLGLIKSIREWGKIRIKLKITPYGEQVWEHLNFIMGRLENGD